MAENDADIVATVGADVDPAVAQLRKVVVEFDNILHKGKEFEEAFARNVGAVADEFKNLRKLVSGLSLGGVEAAITNAGIRGEGARLRATEGGQDVELARQQVALKNQFVKLAKEAAGYVAQERAETEKLEGVEKARAVVAERMREVRNAVASGARDQLSGANLANLRTGLTSAYVDLGEAERVAAADQAREKQAQRERAEAEAENRAFDRRSAYQQRLAALTRREADEENRAFDLRAAAAARRASGQRAEAEAENRDFDLKTRYQTLRESLTRREADADNREFDLRERAKARRAADIRAEADADNREFDLRERALERKLQQERRDADAENKEFNRLEAVRNRKLQAQGVVTPDLAERNAAGRTAKVDALLGDGGAALFQIQARLYAQYAVIQTVLNAFKGLTQGVVELDQELRNLQAISGSTDAQMEGLKTTILDIGQTSRFSLTELAQGATTMAQAGLNAQQVAVALKGTVELAAATGSTLKDSVDLVTTALTVFNLRAEETGKIGDLVSAALNQSKLTVDKFASGLQYAGNIAAEAGDDLQDLSSFLAVLANAGLKGSNAGTGLREIYLQLQKPSQEFQKQLEQVGLTTEQVDIKTQGLTGVLHTLAEAGFSSGNAIQSFGTRGAAAFVALERGLTDVDRFEGSFRNADGAAAAAGVQMEGLEAKMQRLGSSATAAASVMEGDFVKALDKVVDVAAGSLKVIQDHKVAAEVLGTVLASLATGALVITAAKFTGLTAAASSAGTAMAALGGEATFAQAGSLLLAGALNPVVLVATALTAAVAYMTDGFGLWARASDDLAGKLETLKTGINESKGKADEYKSSIDAVDAATDTLADRGARLDGDQTALNQTVETAQQRFGALGLSIDGTSHSVEGLLTAYNKLRGELAKGLGNTLRDQADQLGQQGEALKQQLGAKDFKAPASNLLGAFGFGGREDLSGDLGLPGAGRDLTYAEMLRAARVSNPGLATAADALSNSTDRSVLENTKAGLQAQLVSPDLRPGEADALREAIKELTGKIGTLAAIDQARTQEGQARTDAGKFDFAGSPAGQAVIAALKQGNDYFQNRRAERLDGVTDPAVRKEQGAQLQVEALGSFDSHLADARKGLSPEEQAKVEELFGQKITELRQKIIGAAAGVTEEAGKELDKVAQGRLSEITYDLQQLSKKLGGKSTGDDKEILDQIKPLLDEKAAIQKQIFADANPNKWQLAAKNASRIDDQTKEELQGYAEKSADAFKRVNDANLQENISLLDREAAMVERRFTGRNPKGNDADLARLRSLWDRIDAAEIVRKKAQGLDPAQLEKELALIKDARGQKEEDFADRRAKATSSEKFQFKPANDDLIGSLKAPFTLIDKQFSNTAKELEAPLKLLQTRMGALDIPGAAQNTPSYLKGQLGEEAEGLRTEQLRSLSANDAAKRGAIEAQVAELRQSRAELEAQLASLTETLQARDGKPKQPGDEKLQGQYDQTATRVKALDDAIALGEENMQKAGDSAALALEEYQARLDALKGGNLSFAQTLTGSYHAWAESAGVLDSGMKIVGDTTTETLNAMKGGVSDWVIAVTSGTETVGGAFKSMGISILQTLQKIAAERFANALINLLADGITAGFSGMFGPRPGTTTGMASGLARGGNMTPFSTGGPVVGGTAGKDSVPALLMPGEFVLTRHAVEALGKDHVANMNKTRRAATDMVGALAPVQAGGGGSGSPVHVYVVSQDQVPPPGEREIVAHVASNISRGGSLKQLIKTVNR